MRSAARRRGYGPFRDRQRLMMMSGSGGSSSAMAGGRARHQSIDRGRPPSQRDIAGPADRARNLQIKAGPARGPSQTTCRRRKCSGGSQRYCAQWRRCLFIPTRFASFIPKAFRVSLMVSGDFSDGEQAFRAIGRAFELICRRVKLL